jgi:hypothetical protein
MQNPFRHTGFWGSTFLWNVRKCDHYLNVIVADLRVNSLARTCNYEGKSDQRGIAVYCCMWFSLILSPSPDTKMKAENYWFMFALDMTKCNVFLPVDFWASPSYLVMSLLGLKEAQWSPLADSERKDSLSVNVEFVKFHLSRSRKLNFQCDQQLLKGVKSSDQSQAVIRFSSKFVICFASETFRLYERYSEMTVFLCVVNILRNVMLWWQRLLLIRSYFANWTLVLYSLKIIKGINERFTLFDNVLSFWKNMFH